MFKVSPPHVDVPAGSTRLAAEEDTIVLLLVPIPVKPDEAQLILPDAVDPLALEEQMKMLWVVPVPVPVLVARLEAMAEAVEPAVPFTKDKSRYDVPVVVEVNEAVMVPSMSPAIVDTPVLVVTPVKNEPEMSEGLNV